MHPSSILKIVPDIHYEYYCSSFILGVGGKRENTCSDSFFSWWCRPLISLSLSLLVCYYCLPQAGYSSSDDERDSASTPGSSRSSDTTSGSSTDSSRARSVEAKFRYFARSREGRDMLAEEVHGLVARQAKRGTREENFSKGEWCRVALCHRHHHEKKYLRQSHPPDRLVVPSMAAFRPPFVGKPPPTRSAFNVSCARFFRHGTLVI